MMLAILRSFTVLSLFVFAWSHDFIHAQEANVANKEVSVAARQLENVQIRVYSIESLLSDLALFYNIPIGLEIAANDKGFAPYKIDFKQGTLSEFLAQNLSRYNQYTWEIKNGVVNVYPKKEYQELVLDELLKTEINSFSVKEDTTCWDLADSLIATPELQEVLATSGLRHIEPGFTIAYFPRLGRHFTLAVKKMTLKSILNKVIKESPTARFWQIKRNSYEWTFFLNLSAKQEISPVNQGSFFVDFDVSDWDMTWPFRH